MRTSQKDALVVEGQILSGDFPGKNVGTPIMTDVIVMAQYVQENPIAATHDNDFIRNYQEAGINYEIVGLQGCGDLTFNLWNVAFVNSPLTKNEPRLFHLPQEPLESRTYTCLVKWRQPHDPPYSFEDLRFARVNSPATGDLLKRMVRKRAKHNDVQGNEITWEACGDMVEFAVSNQQIIRNSKKVDVSRITGQFSDLRHLLQMPNLNPSGTLFDGEPDQGRPRFYYGSTQQDDIWFGEAQLIDSINLQRAAMSGPVFLSRLYDGLGASGEQIVGAMKGAAYEQVSDPSIELKEGQYRFDPDDDRQVEVFFRPNVYAWSMIGLEQGNKRILCLACDVDRKTREYLLDDAATKFIGLDAHNALLIDEGQDVFQIALSDVAVNEYDRPTVTVAGGNKLAITGPVTSPEYLVNDLLDPGGIAEILNSSTDPTFQHIRSKLNSDSKSELESVFSAAGTLTIELTRNLKALRDRLRTDIDIELSVTDPSDPFSTPKGIVKTSKEALDKVYQDGILKPGALESCIVKSLKSLLTREDLYDSTVFQATERPPSKLSEDSLKRYNRALLDSLFGPDRVVPYNPLKRSRLRATFIFAREKKNLDVQTQDNDVYSPAKHPDPALAQSEENPVQSPKAGNRKAARD